MPARRDPDRSRIEDALAALSGALSETGAPWMVIGGIAVIAHGVQRMTTDIDAVIRGDAVSVAALIGILQRHQIEPRVDNPEAFAAANLVLLARHRPTEVDLDLSFGWTAFEHEALAACASTRYGKVAAPMAGVDDLLVFKAMAARPRDIDDAVTLLTLFPDIDVARVRRRLAVLADLALAPELNLGLERILQAATEAASHVVTRPSPRRPTTPPSRKATPTKRPPRATAKATPTKKTGRTKPPRPR